MHRSLIGMYNVDSHLKPHLSLRHMVKRVQFVHALLTGHNQATSTFDDFNLTIDIDEKWFYVVPMKRKIRMYPEDEYPGDDTPQHKAHIPKIMFLAAIGKPHTLPDALNLVGKLESGLLLRTLKLRESPKIVLVARWKLKVRM